MSAGASEYIPAPEKVSNSNSQPDISLITGEMRSASLYTAPDSEPTSDATVICRNHIQTVAQISPAGECFVWLVQDLKKWQVNNKVLWFHPELSLGN